MLGLLALVFPVLASVWTVAVVGVLFLIGGIVGWIATWPVRTNGALVAGAVVSTLFIVAGGSILKDLRQETLQQVAMFALAIGIVFLVEGVVAS